MQPEREIIIIPPTKAMDAWGKEGSVKRVVPYIRVSTDSEEQLGSFHAQRTYYTDLIIKTPNWRLADTYADEGISGAQAEKRPDFMRMIRDCKRGKIDLIITKSISRFARNTLDSIAYVRKLRAMGIGVIFQKENINTLEDSSEVVLTILASLAQEELNSLSKNVKMGKQMAMKEGKVHFGKLYGYRKNAENIPEIVGDEAEVVKSIFESYLMGKSVSEICAALNAGNISAPMQKSEWATTTLRNILGNERYCGDVLMQKTFVTDPISKKVNRNTGELPKVYVKNNHVAIVSRELFERAQREKSRRASKRKVSQKNGKTELGKYSSKYALTELLVCGECGSAYRRATWAKKGTKRVVWRCTCRLDYGTRYCKKSPTLDEYALHDAILKAFAATKMDRSEMISYLTENISQTLLEESDRSMEMHKIEQQIESLKAATMELFTLSFQQGNISENEDKLKAMSEETKALQEILEQYKQSHSGMDLSEKTALIADVLEAEPEVMRVYDDGLVRQLVREIKVVNVNQLAIDFMCGVQLEVDT